jgi:NADH-quinone oxidoreductase subunit N
MIPTINTSVLLRDSLAFLPELILCVAIVLMLAARLFPTFRHSHMGGMALLLVLAALALSICQGVGANLGPAAPASESESAMERFNKAIAEGMRPLAPDPERDYTIFEHLLIYDNITIYLRCFLYGFTALLIVLTLTSGIPDREDSADFYCLLLGATLGMAVMAEATHLLMLYLGVEMASLPSYALAGYLKGRRQSSEAALKYVVYGGGASGVMLFGISLLAGKFGTGYLPDVAVGIVRCVHPAGGVGLDPVVLLGSFFLLVGIAFKLSVVPFHFWCPDVFEGASAEVAGYLSVASKGAALVMLARVTLFLAGLDPTMHNVADARWMDVGRILIPGLAFFAAITATFGNLAAYLQTNLKRLLAYSTIAHAGYMVMGLCTLTKAGVQAVLFYLAAYLFTNLGAFAVVAYLRNETGSEDLSSFRGLVRRSPVMVVTLSIFLLSLLGIPPLVGFMAKFEVFSALYYAGDDYAQLGEKGLAATLYALLIIGGVNSVISAMYYVKVMKVMILDRRAEDLEGREPMRLREPAGAVGFAGLLAAATFVLGAYPAPLDLASAGGGDRVLAAVRNAPPIIKLDRVPQPARAGGGPPPPPPKQP